MRLRRERAAAASGREEDDGEVMAEVKDAQAWTTVYARCKKLAWSSSRKGLAGAAEEAIEDGSGGEGGLASSARGGDKCDECWPG